ncbi:GNAT family N-acetyltransferase [Paenibacillus kobensis]|uniref:GNAT family N-acetyltransferase n=1 Tax=Paenibacillus kobensis TaxID=59841 RepID=UPI000FD9E0AB|nr:GNAT family N-acetyltransferase [Paenibacillus kobensis]
MNPITVHTAGADHLEELAVMNKQLIEDEQHDNPMNIEQLQARMAGFIEGHYSAYLFKQDGELRGYALVDHARKSLYLRQFFIMRESRRGGLGTLAFTALLNHLGTGQIDIEVMFWNERGYRFWRSLGFQERSFYMRLDGAQVGQDR